MGALPLIAPFRVRLLPDVAKKSITCPPPALTVIGLARVVVPLFPAIVQMPAGVIVIVPEPSAVLLLTVRVPAASVTPPEKVFAPLNIKALPPDFVREAPTPAMIPGTVRSLEVRLMVTAPPRVMPRLALSVELAAEPSDKAVPGFRVS